jgi:hypothetical protein
MRNAPNLKEIFKRVKPKMTLLQLERKTRIKKAVPEGGAGLNDNCQVFTTDRNFLVYRRKGRGVIPLLALF